MSEDTAIRKRKFGEGCGQQSAKVSSKKTGRESRTISLMLHSMFRSRYSAFIKWISILAVLLYLTSGQGYSRAIETIWFKHCPTIETVPIPQSTLTVHAIGQTHTFGEYRFYVYADEAITRPSFLSEFRQSNFKGNDEEYLDHVTNDARSEEDVISALQDHPWRTSDPDLADFFIVPTPIATLLAFGGRKNLSYFDECFSNLTQHPLYKRWLEHRHIIVSFHWSAFNDFPTYVERAVPALSRNYKILDNVTIATRFDDDLVMDTLHKADKGLLSLRGFGKIYRFLHRATCCSFSQGHGVATRELPLLLASYKAIQKKTISIFYHSRKAPKFGCNSTQYRNGPLQLVESNRLRIQNLSVGHEISSTQFRSDLMAAKFCLVIRGDDPSSHMLLRALRVGCIPVIVSDLYPKFAPVLKSTLRMQDFSISISEDAFLDDMVGELQKLQDLDRSFLERKIERIAWAQRILFPDHPESLFVPAFLKEAVTAKQAAKNRTYRFQ